MIELDGTENKGRLGANAILGVSLAGRQGGGRCARAAALSLCRRRQRHMSCRVPMMNIINGGEHADNPIDFQEFMIVPVGADEHRRGGALRLGDFPHAQEENCTRRASATGVGDEGGFAPNIASTTEALDFIMARRSKRRATSRATTSMLARSIAPPPSIYQGRSLQDGGRGQDPVLGENRATFSPNWLPSIRSSRSRTAWPRMIGRAGRR